VQVKDDSYLNSNSVNRAEVSLDEESQKPVKS
jgi:hypothetical protein